MVAHLVRLRLLVLKNSLLRSPWQLIAVIVGGLYGLGVLGLLVAGMIALGGTDPEFTRTVVVLGGSVVVLGWLVGPLVAAGADQTLDPARLVTFPLSQGQLLAGMTASGILGIPGIITTLAFLATIGSWWRHPIAAVAALVCALVGLLTCVVGSRMVSVISTRLSSMRRFREISGIIALIPLVLLGPIIIAVTSGLRSVKDVLPAFADAAAWTPLGAVWAVPAEIALGHFALAGAHFVIAGLALVALVWLWRVSLAAALVTPSHTASRSVARGKLGFFSLFPATGSGAVAARALTYWVRDPRYAKQLIMIPLIPALMFFYSSTTGSVGLLNLSGPIVALILSLSIFADVSFDNTAFAMHLSTGLRGVADRAGRVMALAVFAVPVVIVFTVASVWISASWQILPGLLGLALGILLTGFGISSVTSARIVFPVPAPGDSPFKSPPGAGLISAVSMFATWGALVALVLPELVLALASFTIGSILLGWIALAVGAVLGSVLLIVGIRVGGTVLDDRAPELLAQLQRQG